MAVDISDEFVVPMVTGDPETSKNINDMKLISDGIAEAISKGVLTSKEKSRAELNAAKKQIDDKMKTVAAEKKAAAEAELTDANYDKSFNVETAKWCFCAGAATVSQLL